ncbi:MAG: prepilin-type N-terminal cleavage/methylation domain-containing protein [Calditrichaeota bacterium]|nr:MAG: prepilin-type N-terminal cleavage/methylation domain-containing protein [Calditrichota bacterium]
MKINFGHKGFTLIEVVMAVVIAGILATIAIRSTVTITETGRVEITKTELKDIGYAISGNPNLENNGIRTDFGYVGDVGALPTTLNDLLTNPGGYATWNGPYVKNRFDQTPSDYLEDAWGVAYSYSGVDLTSTGSGTNIVHKVGQNTSEFLLNSVSGNIYDADGTPPGTIYKDSIVVLLTIPNGAGALVSKGIYPDLGGYFSYDSIPVGNHDLLIIYQPTNDTLRRLVSVLPNSEHFNSYLLSEELW